MHQVHIALTGLRESLAAEPWIEAHAAQYGLAVCQHVQYNMVQAPQTGTSVGRSMLPHRGSNGSMQGAPVRKARRGTPPTSSACGRFTSKRALRTQSPITPER